MRLEVSGHQIDITPALKDFVTAKLERISRHFDHHLDLRVLLSVDKLQHKAEATLTPRGKALHAEAEAGVQGWVDANPQDKFGKHEYKLAQYGLRPDQVSALFERYLSRYHVEAEG